jgi:N-acetylmuramoyl-L-alanine amidase
MALAAALVVTCLPGVCAFPDAGATGSAGSGNLSGDLAAYGYSRDASPNSALTNETAKPEAWKRDRSQQKKAREKKPRIIVIDAGHQKRANSGMEPIGPGARTRKPKVSGGTRGVATGNPEYKINLQVAKKLRDVLKKRNYTVYMVRVKHNVNIPNSRRAKFANRKKADLFIRLHCDAAGYNSGFLTLTPAKNQWTKKFYKRSMRAAKTIHKEVLKKTKANDRGIAERGDLSGFNHAKVPSVLFEMGVMTNAKEDRKLATEKYQMKLAKGMANGVDKYFNPHRARNPAPLIVSTSTVTQGR